MEENSTEQRWQERRRHRSELVWSCRYQHKTHVPTQHPLCYEGVLKVVAREWKVLSSTCRYGTYRKEIKHQHRSAKIAVSYTHLRAHETPEHLVCRLLLEKKKKK